jgi:hypothetical protein
MRIWSQTGALSANVFIANIPEHPCEYDYFNLTKLLSTDGRMSPKWINLYGSPLDERNANTKGRREGSAYLGRVLLSFSLIPHERPALQASGSNSIKAPRNGYF